VPNILKDNVQNLSSQMIKEEQNQCCDLFRTMFIVTDRRCRVIIDGDTCNNLVSSELVEKLSLTTEPHPHPYYIKWPTSSGKLKVNEIIKIQFSIGTYNDSAYFDVVPMESCSLLLAKPWISNNNVSHDVIANAFSFKHNGRKIKLIPMTAAEILKIDIERATNNKIEALQNTLSDSNDCSAAPCEKERLCDDLSTISMPQIMNKHDFVALESITCAENNIFLPIANFHDELKLLSSLNTLGYIEFDVLCNLNNLKKKIFMNADLPWFARNTYHFIGKYDTKGEYMVHRVYICSNMKSTYVGKQYDQLEGCTNANHITSSSSCFSMFALKQQDQLQEGERGWMISRTSTTTSTHNTEFESRTTQSQEGENDEDMFSMHMTKAQEKTEFQAQSMLEYNLFTSSVGTAG